MISECMSVSRMCASGVSYYIELLVKYILAVVNIFLVYLCIFLPSSSICFPHQTEKAFEKDRPKFDRMIKGFETVKRQV